MKPAAPVIKIVLFIFLFFGIKKGSIAFKVTAYIINNILQVNL